MSFSVFTSIMTYKKKSQLGNEDKYSRDIFCQILDVFLLKMQGKQVQKKFKTAYPWSAPIMTYLGLLGSKSPPLKYS